MGIYSISSFAQESPVEPIIKPIDTAIKSESIVVNNIFTAEKSEHIAIANQTKLEETTVASTHSKPTNVTKETYSTTTFANDIKAIKWDAIGALLELQLLG